MNESVNHQTKKVRFNIIDLVVVLLILGCIAAVVLPFLSRDTLTSAAMMKNESVEMYVPFVITFVEPYAAEKIETGNSLYTTDAESNEMGEVVCLNKLPTRDRVDKADGTFQFVENPNYCDIMGILKISLVETDQGFVSADSNVFNPNCTVNFSCNGWVSVLTVLDVSENKEEMFSFVDSISSNRATYNYYEGSNTYARLDS